MADKFQVGEFCWNELATPNVQKARDFYSKVFGWTFEEHPTDNYVYTIIKKNGKEIGGIWAIPTEKQKDIPPHWMSYILVENIADFVKKAEQNGAKVLQPPKKAGKFGTLAVIIDPTGAHIAFWEPANM